MDTPVSPRGRPIRAGVLFAAGLTALLVLWFGRACWGGWWIADETHTVDMYMIATIYERCAAQIAGGHLPLWFPEFAGGYPVHAAWMYGMFYPPLMLFSAIPAEAAWTWIAIAHIVFGGLGMFAFLWDERRDTVAAAAGGLVFALSGFMLGRVLCGHMNLVLPFAWAPWVLRGAMRTVRGEPGAVVWLGICAGIGLIAGHVQVWFYVGPLAAAYAIFEASRRGVLRAASLRLAAGAAIALGIAAIQWLPARELFNVSGHPPEPKALVILCSAPFAGLAAQIAPGFVAPITQFEHEYLGLAGPLAVLAALLAFRLRDGRRWFWFVVLALGLLLAMGTRTWISTVANEMPPFRFARAPGRAMTLVVLAGSVLAGNLVADWIGGRLAKWRAFVPAMFAASALAFGVPMPRLVRADFQDYDWMRSLPPEARGHRVHIKEVRYPYPERRSVETMRNICPLDTPGYKAMTSGPAPVPAPVVAWWFDVAAELWVPWTGAPADAAATAALAPTVKVRGYQPGGRFWYFPRAEVANDADAIARMRTGERVLLVAADAEPPAPPGSLPGTATVGRSPQGAPNEIAFDVDASAPGWVLVSSKWYPGWNRVDDTTLGAGVRRANLALVAVPVRRGASRVVLRYEPTWMTAALVLCIAGWTAALGLLVLSRRRMRDSPASR